MYFVKFTGSYNILVDEMKVVIFHEGRENEQFWKLLGGKGDYFNTPELQEDVKEPRLFHCSNASGYFD